MKKIVLFATVLLASCGQVGPSTSETQQSNLTRATPVSRLSSNQVVKFCDQGRAIYAVDDDNSSALAVVENAQECKK